MVVQEPQSLLALLRWQGPEMVEVQSGFRVHAVACLDSSLPGDAPQQGPFEDKFGEAQRWNTFFLAL